VTSRFRFRLALAVGSIRLSLSLLALFFMPGCGELFHAGPLSYVESERMTSALEKPESRKVVREAMTDLFGADPQHIKVPEGSGFWNGGIRLSSLYDKGDGNRHPVMVSKSGLKEDAQPQTGGYSVYRKHCLHCHGVSGAGDGPTAPFLYPRPRDYRKGLFKFTSTPTGAKPTRSDLRKTVQYGLHGTSMPAFESLMSASEIEQVLDYMIFLSMRGETELALIDEAAAAGELPKDVIAEVSKSVFNKWKSAESQAMNPPIPKPPSTRESVLRGRDLFLAQNKTGNKVDCTSCHGAHAVGNGPSFVAEDVFFKVVFGGEPSEQGKRLEEVADEVKSKAIEESGDPKAGEDAHKKLLEAWKNSLDDWGNPLRPGNLNRGERTVYKGGRRPIDIYWRIAKGINGAKMPAHFPTLEPERIWDLVNFVLALPYDPALLDGAKLPSSPPPGAPKPGGVASR
jgi:mono/diheme cytochrome c family protein